MSHRTSIALLVAGCFALFTIGLISSEALASPWTNQVCEIDGTNKCSQYPCVNPICASTTGNCKPGNKPIGYCGPHIIWWCNHGATCGGYCEDSGMTRGCSCQLGDGWCD